MLELLYLCNYNAGDVWVGLVTTTFHATILILLIARMEPTELSPLKSHLLLDPESEKGVDPEFLSEAVRRFDEDESVKPAFITAVELLSQELASMSITDDYKSYMTVC